MSTLDVALPMDVFIPVYWTRTRQALVRSVDGKCIGMIQRVVTYTRRVLGVPLSHLETLNYNSFDNPTPQCKIAVHARFPLEFLDADSTPLGHLTPKTLSVWPEYDCMDQDERVIGKIQPGSHKAEFKFNNCLCRAHFSRAMSKGLRPRQYVWEYRSDDVSSMDMRLLLAFIVMGQMPGPSPT